jgi:hypothetical protein
MANEFVSVSAQLNFFEDYLEAPMVHYDTTNDKLLFVYRGSDGGEDYFGKVVVGTPGENDSVVFGAPVTFFGSNSNYYKSVFDPSTGQCVLFVYDFTTFTGKAVVGQVSGNSFVTGTPVEVVSGTPITPVKVVYDDVNDKVVLFYLDDSVGNLCAVVCTVTAGQGITFGTPVVITTAYDPELMDACFMSDEGKVVFVFDHNTGGKIGVGTVSGTSISFGSFTDFSEIEGMSGISIAYDAARKGLIVTYTNSSSSWRGDAQICTVSGDTVTVGSSSRYSTSTYPSSGIVDVIFNDYSGNIIIFYKTTEASDNLVAVVGTPNIAGGYIDFADPVLLLGTSDDVTAIHSTNVTDDNRVAFVFSDLDGYTNPVGGLFLSSTRDLYTEPGRGDLFIRQDSETESILNIGGDITSSVYQGGSLAIADTPSPGFGYGSYYFNGTEDALVSTMVAEGSSTASFGTGEFTIDFWIRPDVAAAVQGVLSTNLGEAQTYESPIYISIDASGLLNVSLSSTATSFDVVANNTALGAVVNTTWAHVAITRKNDNIYLFKDGVLMATIPNAAGIADLPLGEWGAGGAVNLGCSVANFTPGDFFTGYMANFRIDSDEAYWDSTFNLTDTELRYVAGEEEEESEGAEFTALVTTDVPNNVVTSQTPTVTISGTAPTGTAGVTWNNKTKDASGTATGTEEWVAEDVPLNNWKNKIDISVEDSEGGVTTEELVVQYLPNYNKLSYIYRVESANGNIRGKAKEGYTRPTVKDFRTSNHWKPE